MNFGIALQRIRTRQYIAQEEFASILGLSQSALSRIESGERKPSHAKLLVIAKKLKISVGLLYLLALEETDFLPKDRAEIQKLVPIIQNTIDQLK